MGRIRTKMIKRSADEFRKINPDTFNDKFENNKQKVQELSDVSTKKLRNKIAGYLTKLAKNDAK